MALQRHLQIRQLESIKGGMAEFYTPQASHETMLVSVPANTVDDLFVHHFQTDQLLVVRGSFVLVSLQNRQFQYTALCESVPLMVTIPPGIPHGAINFSDEPCVMVNAVLRHGPTHAKDYQPLRPPFPYDFQAARAALAQLDIPLSA